MFGWFKKSAEAKSVAIAESGETAPAATSTPATAAGAAVPAVFEVAREIVATETAGGLTGAEKTAASPATAADCHRTEFAKPSEPAPATEQKSAAAPDDAATAAKNLPLSRPLRRDILPKGYREPLPDTGMIAIEIAGARVRNARVSAIRANGRKLLAEVGSDARSYTYTRLADGTYRLGDNPSQFAPRLVLGLGG